MKPLHESKFDTESGSRAYTAVCAGLTPTGEPFRRIVVEVNAEMDTTEARWLRDKLDLAITLAESTEPVEGDRITRFLDAWRQEKERFAPAVSEDQPTPREPRVFPKGSPEPEGVVAVTDEAGFRWNRAGRVNARQHHWRRADLGVMGSFVLWARLNRRPLSEVLADSEQVTCNGSGLVEDGDASTSEFNFRGPHDGIGEPPPKPCSGCVNCAKAVRHG